MGIKKICSRIYEKIFFLCSWGLSIKNKKIIYNWRIYKYLEKKYKKFLNELPNKENTNEYSNKVWWYWHEGEEKAPELCKACLKSLRANLKNREIIVITNENIDKYVQFPDYIKEKYKKGIISNAHYSDLLRISLLVKYGGTWMDSTVFCTGYDERIFDKSLFVYKNFCIDSGDESIVASNWFITSEKNNPILVDTRELLFKYWKEHNFVVHYYIFHFFFHMVTEKYADEWKKVPKIPNSVPHLLQFELLDEYSEERYNQIKELTTIHKLTRHLELPKDIKGTIYEHIIK